MPNDKEIEVKFLEINTKEMRNKIIELGGKRIHPPILFQRYLFHLPNNTRRGFVRCRQEGSKTTLTLKIYLLGSKFPIEKELECENNLDEVRDFLLSIGLKIKSYHQSIREKWFLKGTNEIVFDNLPGLPSYMEIECTFEKDIPLIVNKLGLDMKNARYGGYNKEYKYYYDIDDDDFNDKLEKLTFYDINENLKGYMKKNEELLRYIKKRQESMYKIAKDKLEKILEKNKKEKKSKIEIEKKILDISYDDIINKLNKLKCDQIHPLLSYERYLFNLKNTELKGAFRVRCEGIRTAITCKTWKEGETYPREYELNINNSVEEGRDFFIGLGYPVVSYMQSLREKWKYNEEIEIVLDYVPGLPLYMEIEADKVSEVDKMIKKLNLNDKETATYDVSEMYKILYGITNTEYKEIEMITFKNIDDELKKDVNKNMDLLEELKVKYLKLYDEAKNRSKKEVKKRGI